MTKSTQIFLVINCENVNLPYRELESQAVETVKASVLSFDKRHFSTKYYVSYTHNSLYTCCCVGKEATYYLRLRDG